MTDTDITIDIEQITTLIQQYHDTDSRAKQREIENSVLSETVWKDPLADGDDEFTISGDSVELIYSALPDDAKEAKRLLRALYVHQM